MKNSVTMYQSATGSQMMCFVVTTSEGGVILIDGGYRKDAEGVIELLKKITGQSAPHLDAIFLTHPHLDHIGAFIEWTESMPNALTYDKLFARFPSEQFLASDPDCALLTDFYALMPRFADKLVFPSRCDRYAIKGAEFEILYTTDDAFTMNACNNSSMVFRMTLGGKTFLFTGDCGIEAGDKIVAMYGDDLKSDHCQLAHHGQSGVSKEFYERVKPQVCLWCTPLWLWNNDAGNGYNTHTWQTITVQNWLKEIVPDHKDVIMKDGTATIEL